MNTIKAKLIHELQEIDEDLSRHSGDIEFRLVNEIHLLVETLHYLEKLEHDPQMHHAALPAGEHASHLMPEQKFQNLVMSYAPKHHHNVLINGVSYETTGGFMPGGTPDNPIPSLSKANQSY